MEVIYCAAGNPEFCRIAIEQGLRYGAQLPNTIYAEPYFVDQNWKNPVRKDYMAKLREYQPTMATVLDLERADQLSEVLDWAHEASQWVEVVVIIPKAHGIIAHLPETINGKEIRLGFSVPTRFGGTEVFLTEFEGRPVHLLGGSPKTQLRYSRYLNAKSLDGNMFQKMATGRAIKVWDWSRGWVFLSQYNGYTGHNSPYHAFELSAKNIIEFWKDGLNMFNRMNEANEAGELIGHICNFHRRRDGQVTIHEIIVQKSLQGQGIGNGMLETLKHVEGATSLFAKCPADLASNGWYKRMGFVLEQEEITKTGKTLNHWRLTL